MSKDTTQKKSPFGMFRVKFSVKLMVQVAMLIALEIVFNRFLSIRTPIVKIGFSFVPIVVAACAYGPVWATVTYVAADLLGVFIEGNMPLPGLTLSCALMGFMFGVFLYGRDDFELSSFGTWVAIVTPVAINQLIISLLVNSYWLWNAGFFGGSYTSTVVARVPQTALLIPVQVIIIPVLLRVVRILRNQKLLG